jgi:hypothetical protein
MKALAAIALMIMLASAASTQAAAQAEQDITPITQQALAPPLALMLPFGPPPSAQAYKRMLVLQFLMATQDALHARQAIPLMRDSRSEADDRF